MRLPNLNTDLWELVRPEEMTAEVDCAPQGSQLAERSPAAMPYATNQKTLKRGEGVLLIFRMQPTPDEISPGMQGRMQRMWVAVDERCGDYYIGILNVHPSGNYTNRDFYLSPGAEIPFLPHHIVDINRPPFGFDIKKVLQTDPRRLWNRDNSQEFMGDPLLRELLEIADRNAVKEVQEENMSSAFGIGRTTATTWSDRFITTGIRTTDGSDALMEAVTPLQEQARQKTLLASVVCNRRRLQRTSGGEFDAIVMLLENARGYSVYWLRVYRQTDQGYEFDQLTAQFGEPVVFPPYRTTPN
jgi:hypothetical protein